MNETLTAMANPPHPGAFIVATYLEPLNVSAGTFAGALGVAATTVTRVLAGLARVSPEMAVRLEKVLGRSAESWLSMQKAYDLAAARGRIDAVPLRRLPELTA